MPEKTSNIKKVSDFMSFSSPINQIFILTALTNYAEYVVNNKDTVLKQMEHGFISGPAWVEAAENWLKVNP